MRYFFAVFCCVLFSFLTPSEARLTWTGVQQDFQESLKHAGDSVSESRISPFGNSRLIAESSGIKGKVVIMAGVEVAIDPGWVLNTPVIQATATGGYKATVLPQFRQTSDDTESWDNQYQNHVIFPILLEGKPTEDVILTVQADLSACSDRGQRCVNSHEAYQLILPVAHAYPTSVAAPLQRSLISAAIDIGRSRLKMENTQMDDQRLKIRIICPEKVKFVDLQSTAKPFDIANKSLKGNVFSAVLKFQEPVQLGEEIPINIKTSRGNYTAQLKVSEKSLAPVSDGVSLWIAFWTGLFFLVTSSVWPLLMCPHKITQGHFGQGIRRLQVGIIGAMVLLGMLWICDFAPTVWIQNGVILSGILVLLLYLMVKPIQPIWVVAVCLIILPKPFWYVIDSVSVSGKIWLLIWWSCCLLIPFNLWILCARPIISFFWRVEEGPHTAYSIFIRLPYLILLGWLIIGGINPMIKNDDIGDLKEIKTPAVIQVAPRVCFKCAVNQWRTFPFLPFPLYQIDSNSEVAKRWGLGRDSALILITKNYKEVILPDDLTLNQLKKTIGQEL